MSNYRVLVRHLHVKEWEITVPNTCHLSDTTQLYAGLCSHMQQHTTQCGLVQANTAIYGLMRVNPAWCEITRQRRSWRKKRIMPQEDDRGASKYTSTFATVCHFLNSIYSRPIVEDRTKSPSDILLFTLVHATIFYSILDYLRRSH
jgi:hypothetical protein